MIITVCCVVAMFLFCLLRDLQAVAVLLLQCGANPNLQNRRGLIPADLARSEQMARILKVAPIREIKNSVSRFEGPIIRVRYICAIVILLKKNRSKIDTYN